MFRKILMATDFAESAETAWGVAMELARLHDAELVLLHVYMALPAYSEAAAAQVAQIYEEQQRWVQDALDQRVSAAGAAGLTATPRLKTGSAADGIVGAALEEQADLVVLGTHGRRGLERWVVGSVAERVVREAPCPVLIVKARPTAGAAARAAA